MKNNTIAPFGDAQKLRLGVLEKQFRDGAPLLAKEKRELVRLQKLCRTSLVINLKKFDELLMKKSDGKVTNMKIVHIRTKVQETISKLI